MVERPVRILCTGDIHMGRRPTRLPDSVDHPHLSTTAAWARIVDTSIDEDVDAVVLTGDVVDQANKHYESMGPLEAGLRRLVEADIPTFAVTGNHDHDVLADLCDQFDDELVHLLGPGGTWERAALERDGRTVVHFDGWSFPGEHVARNPIDGYDPEPADAPVIGLLHCDLDQLDSRYAPVRLADLRATQASAWLLGHIHARRLEDDPGGPPVLYPGSPQPMDPGEPGRHGPWIVEVHARDDVRFTHLPTATVRYERVEVDASEPDKLDARIHSGIRDKLEAAIDANGALEVLACRLVLTGRTPVHRELPDRAATIRRDVQVPHGDAQAHVETVVLETRPAVDLADLARGDDPPGELAKLILELDNGTDPAEHDLVRQARQRMLQAAESNAYTPLRGDGTIDEPTVEDARRALADQANRLLDELLAQKEAPP